MQGTQMQSLVGELRTTEQLSPCTKTREASVLQPRAHARQQRPSTIKTKNHTVKKNVTQDSLGLLY